jgi:2,4-dihydroxyhept-2-ene-1,7-dioic acid aldolase
MHTVHKMNEKIAAGKMVFGSHIAFDSPFITEMLAGCGYDFIWIDSEHGALDKKDIQLHLMACRAAGVSGIVRVPWNDFVFIKGVLDMGADGIVVPLVRNAKEAEMAVAATTYPPEGIRGLGVRRAVNYGLGDVDEYVANAREKIWTIIQIEHIDLVKDLDTIAQMPGVTGFVMGPKDFSMSMCTSSRMYTPSDPEVKEQFDKIGEILSRYNKPFGVSAVYSEAFVADWTKRGVNFLCMNFDFHFVTKGGKAVLDGAKSALTSLGRPF